MVERKGRTRERTRVTDTGTRTTVWGLTVGVGWAEKGKGGESGTMVIA